MARTQKKIDPIAVAAFAMAQVKTKADYSRIVAANTEATISEAWASLSTEDQQRISSICNESPQPDLNAIAIEIIACGTYLELQALKSEHGEVATRGAWKLISVEERRRLKTLCDNGVEQAETPQPVTEEPHQTQVESQHKPRTLFSISSDLEKLSELLDESDGDDENQYELINNWLETLGSERDRKLDNYSALIVECTSRAAARKVEAQRLMELATSDENRARLLKDRLKWFFQTHNLATVETARYKLSLARNGGKQPVIIKDGISAVDLPERFQAVSVDPNTIAIRDALERGEKLDFAQLGERGTSMRIK